MSAVAGRMVSLNSSVDFDGFRRDNDNDRAGLLLRFFEEILLIDALQGTCPWVSIHVAASCTLLRTA